MCLTILLRFGTRKEFVKPSSIKQIPKTTSASRYVQPPKNEFDLYLRDIQLILNEIGKDVCIHLRKHPLRYEGNWIYNFRDLLNKNGINSINGIMGRPYDNSFFINPKEGIAGALRIR